MTTTKINLASLVTNLGLAAKVDSFNQLLNTPPPEKWLKTHPMERGVKYLPVDVVKLNLAIIFQDYDWSIKDVKIYANSVLVFGTLSVINPVTERPRYLDGIGAVPLELTKGAAPCDFTQIKSRSVHKNAPAAESFALKNAAAKLGTLFGGGLNTDPVMTFQGVYSAAVAQQRTLDKENFDTAQLTTKTAVLKAAAQGLIDTEKAEHLLGTLAHQQAAA